MISQKKHTIIGMAGHIDHGKTELIRAMTGLETDRLKEEKERGITIDLGFAYWKDDVTIIDVPGHEKFIRNMVTGVNAVDIFLLVIAADDGIMPQTREHFEILNFFGITSGVVALNKIDLVDDEWRALVKSDIEEFLRKNNLPDIPIVEVSARTGFGIANLRSEILNKIERVQPRKDSRPFRLNIDRSFSLKGHGTVVTGTVLSSSIKTGEAVQILPQGIISKIRAIQVHKNDTERALAGQRAAINLANVTPKESARGSVIVRPHTLLPTDSLLAEINTVNSLPFAIKKHAKVHIHLGTFETIGKISWYGEEKVLENGKSYIVYIKLNAFAAPAVDDPILLRSFSPVITIAGGKVLQINPPKLKKDSDSIETYYNTLKSGTISERITAMVEREGFRLFTINDFVKMLFLNETVIRKAAEKLVKGKKIIAQEVNNGTVFLSAEKLHTMMRIIESKMKEKVENYSFRAGFNVNEILELVKKYRIDEKYLDIALKLGINKGIFSVKNNLYNLKEAMKAQEQNIHFEKVEALYLSEGFTPPDFKSAAEKLSLKEKDVKDICTELHKRGILVSVLGKFYLHNEKYNTLLAYLKDYFGKNNTIKISAVRDFTQSSRKFVIPLMEYLDQKNITERSGEDRIKGANL